MKWNKNKSLSLYCLTLLALSIGCKQEKQSEETASTPPNIIFIMADDLGYADLGAYGQELIQTPNIDRLAREGVMFTQVYAGNTVCAPSRSVLMTGKHMGHTTVRGNSSPLVQSDENPQGRVPLLEEDVTVAELLKDAGYVTGMTGKWGLGEPGTTGIPTRQGFDEWFGYLNQRRAHNYYTDYLWKNEIKYPIPENEGGQEEIYSHDLFTDFALDFIETNKDTSFFLYIPYTIPHDEYEVPDTAPYNEKDWEENEIIYAAMVSRMDRDVGRIMQSLRDLKIDENTILFFCSDNGAAQRWEGRFDSSGNLRGRKRDMYEGGLRTPMIVHYPGQLQPRTDSSAVWYFADVLPTLTHIAGTQTPSEVDGINVWPAISGQESLPADRFLYWEFYERGFQRAVRWKDWKAILPGVGQQWELYNLEEDEGEENNIAAQHPEVINTIKDWVEDNTTESQYWSASTQ
ncbi:arylsulfatase A-like enzyme [Catalinimonas alkaloidigena]|uniref:arylsulfatase n=1 Tax=Catalinimonas alkaloidigena TaxID=1075417 RepID=UPI0024055BF1|nr:arylsulfatase [Catalinimonas alkaloidigena]MDF9798984.1 arylsulfatase A-like enzyme [Catalinimonas alkaloidigena]